MYAATLILHSLVRWLFLAAVIATIVSAIRGRQSGAPISPRQRKIATAAVGMADLQLLLGALLYFAFSPWLAAFNADRGAAMRDAATRFFAIEHPMMMMLAIAALHVGWARAKRADDPRIAWRRVLIGFGLALVLVLARIPWPFMEQARPLLRLGVG